MATWSYGADAANVLYHVVNERHIRRRAMVFTTNKHPKRWGDVLHDDDLADAIVDRILERGRLLRLDGPSVRTKHIAADELAGDEYVDLGNRRVSGINAAEFPERTALLASAAMDRLLHDAHVLSLVGETYRNPTRSKRARKSNNNQEATT
ncbi:MAG: ATP-binding protein [Polyangiaceae bacterium]